MRILGGSYHWTVFLTLRKHVAFQDFPSTKLDKSDLNNMWCQQGSAICYWAHEALRAVKDRFDEGRILVAWPSWSCELISLLFFS